MSTCPLFVHWVTSVRVVSQSMIHDTVHLYSSRWNWIIMFSGFTSEVLRPFMCFWISRTLLLVQQWSKRIIDLCDDLPVCVCSSLKNEQVQMKSQTAVTLFLIDYQCVFLPDLLAAHSEYNKCWKDCSRMQAGVGSPCLGAVRSVLLRAPSVIWRGWKRVPAACDKC